MNLGVCRARGEIHQALFASMNPPVPHSLRQCTPRLCGHVPRWRPSWQGAASAAIQRGFHAAWRAALLHAAVAGTPVELDSSRLARGAADGTADVCQHRAVVRDGPTHVPRGRGRRRDIQPHPCVHGVQPAEVGRLLARPLATPVTCQVHLAARVMHGTQSSRTRHGAHQAAHTPQPF